MKRDDFEELERRVMAEVVKRRQLGGYSADAAGILMLCETMLSLIMHFKEQMPREKK